MQPNVASWTSRRRSVPGENNGSLLTYFASDSPFRHPSDDSKVSVHQIFQHFLSIGGLLNSDHDLAQSGDRRTHKNRTKSGDVFYHRRLTMAANFSTAFRRARVIAQLVAARAARWVPPTEGAPVGGLGPSDPLIAHAAELRGERIVK
ncbi:hypothetical protein MCOO_03630 [Mycobacterium cookii]|uniref:Uncharacterized protein n=1 Tax=Mycobacterium cookii TaxID=1775 RepID=A0A7I7KSF2_9MYCO|nr:hypothetical protein MCOO_03630 [Mycobacterium cookii]